MLPDNIRHFKMNVCDGHCAAQVLIFTADDYEYWKDEASRTNHKLEYSYDVPFGYYGISMPFMVYQVLPLDFEVQHA